MSELKAFVARKIDDGTCDPVPCVEVYLKAEADRVIAELEEERRWRKFPDEKPKWGEEVLVVDDANKQYIVRFSYDMKWISWGHMNTCESNCVKFWMPLPEPPEVSK